MKTYRQSYKEALKMIETGAPCRDVLVYLTTAAEKAAETDTVSSIMLIDKSGLLRNGASPKLPMDYIKAIDGLTPHPNLGTCAAAAATGNVVVTQSFYEDGKWAELRHLPLAIGFKGAWSMPITAEDGKVLGTFGTYFREVRVPSEREIKGMKFLTSAAAIAIRKGSGVDC
jgi:GAF domain-containing protein